MSETYTEDQEVEKLKSWWKTYGNALLLGVALGVAILFGNKYWTAQKARRAEAASAVYDQLVTNFGKKAFDNVRQSGATLIDEYAGTPYAGLAAMILARVEFDEGKPEDARRQLQWVVDNATDEGARHAARLRLARLLINDNELDKTRALIEVEDIAGFEADYYELRGDIEAAMGNKSKARAEYEKARERLGDFSSYRVVLNMKIDDLGPDETQ
ncbi:MAG: tetratricopeptide repeat protein [Gammaproteobacteria bacterium]|nr:MAG: tetratricopeptide repeat protein [Gammaproteobacteria bacterium]